MRRFSERGVLAVLLGYISLQAECSSATVAAFRKGHVDNREVVPVSVEKWIPPQGLKQRVIPRDRVTFRVRDSVPQEDHVDVVITWHCESLAFLSEIDYALKDSITVVLLHKGTDEQLAKADCDGLVPDVPFEVVEIRLPNLGRDVESQFKYIYNAYDVLPTYAMFMQADHHWFIKSWLGGAQGFNSNADAVNKMVPFALQRRPGFLPVSPYFDADFQEPVLFVDRESNLDKEGQDSKKPRSLHAFDACTADMFNRVRDTMRTIFGVNPCEEPEVVFVPGFQFLVSRVNILRRPAEVWASLSDLSLDCEPTTYDLERLGVELYNGTRPTLDPDLWKAPFSCPSAQIANAKWFTKQQFDPDLAARYWQGRWGCEPRSGFLRAAAQKRRPRDMLISAK